MDITQIYMVRSAKDNDMLCVDGYLYYYDDKGQKTYRWSCSKRKDKIFPCKSRIVTTLLDEDETKHVVKKIYGEHSHERCSAEEISVCFERKRMANLEGKPCTLEEKSKKRKVKHQLEEGDKNDTSESWKTITPPKKRIKREYEREDDNEAASSSMTNSSINKKDEKSFEETPSNVINLQESTVYMLKTSHGKDMICVDGFLYRFEGSQDGSFIYRWECCRRRYEGCKARLRTERKPNSKHQLLQKRWSHTHQPYSQSKLIKLFNKHNINLFTNDDVTSLKMDKQKNVSMEEFESINCMNNSNYLQLMVGSKTTESNENISVVNDDTLEIDDLEILYDIDISDPEKKEESVESHEKSNISFSEKEKQDEDLENCMSADDPDPLEGKVNFIVKTELDITKIRTLPSARGNKLLCIDDFLYHYDSKSTHESRSYWTCIHRRDKVYNCRARITTEIMESGGLKVVKVYGRHMHPNDLEKIRQRILMNHVISKTEDKSMKPSEIVNSSIEKLNPKYKESMESTRQSLQRKISRLRSVKQKSFNDLQQKIRKSTKDFDNDNLSISSLSDDDMDLPTLPTNIEQMKTNVQHKPDDFRNEDVKLEHYDVKNQNNDFIYEGFDNVEDDDRTSSGTESPDNEILESDMDLKKISILRSAKGNELLCVDDYIYHVKSIRDIRTYWECIKSKTALIKCKSRVATVMTSKGYIIRRVTNRHNHPTSKADIQRRLINSCKERSESKPRDYMVLLERKMMSLEQKMSKVRLAMQRQNKDNRTVMKLYAASDGPPSLAVRMTLKALKIPFELINVDYCASTHLTEEYAKLNPQKEIPVLDDDGFYLSESVAIMQYICDKYAPHSEIYPKEAKKRAVVNHRLCFNMEFYYSTIRAYVVAPIFFDYPRDEKGLKKVKNALSVFETYLKRTNTRFVADDHLTIADFALVSSTLCLEAIEFDLSPYPFVKHWYENFKDDFPNIWEIAKVGMREIEVFEHNPPDLSHMNHPFHPTRKITH